MRPPIDGIVGQEVASPSPPICMTMQLSPMMVTERFWSHWVMVVPAARPPKLISRRSRAPLM
jgi:hypothetical protein